MGAARESTQSDFDLERFIDMFDEALTSDDERVVNALRSLMMMVILTKPEGRKDSSNGPLRRLFDDMNHMNRRMHRTEEEVRDLQRRQAEKYQPYQWDDFKKYSMQDVKYTASSFDDHLAMAQISQQFAKKINGGKI